MSLHRFLRRPTAWPVDLSASDSPLSPPVTPQRDHAVRGEPLWLAKPADGRQGEGISVVCTPEQVVDAVSARGTTVVVQKYLETPMTLHNCVMDLRAFVLVDPAGHALLYQHFLARRNSSPFNKGASDDLLKHMIVSEVRVLSGDDLPSSSPPTACQLPGAAQRVAASPAPPLTLTPHHPVPLLLTPRPSRIASRCSPWQSCKWRRTYHPMHRQMAACHSGEASVADGQGVLPNRPLQESQSLSTLAITASLPSSQSLSPIFTYASAGPRSCSRCQTWSSGPWQPCRPTSTPSPLTYPGASAPSSSSPSTSCSTHTGETCLDRH